MMAVNRREFNTANPLARIVIGATRNWSRKVILWNLAANAQFRPHTDNGENLPPWPWFQASTPKVMVIEAKPHTIGAPGLRAALPSGGANRHGRGGVRRANGRSGMGRWWTALPHHPSFSGHRGNRHPGRGRRTAQGRGRLGDLPAPLGAKWL